MEAAAVKRPWFPLECVPLLHYNIDMNISEHYLYPTHRAIKARCQNPNNQAYKHYGGRGITLCAEWQDSRTFLKYCDDVLGPRPEGHSIDRIDNSKGYQPGNIQWATQSQQITNRRYLGRKHRDVTTDSIRYCLTSKYNQWHASVNHKGKHIVLACCKDKVRCVVKAHIRLWDYLHPS